jgi:hypothetical protein
MNHHLVRQKLGKTKFMNCSRIISVAVALCLGAPLISISPQALAAKVVVISARGGGLKDGQSIESDQVLALKEGERVTLIGPDGKTVTRTGPYNGPAMPVAAAGGDATQGLSALVANREARTSSVGVVRGGPDTTRLASHMLPYHWLVDATRAGARCLQEGELPVFWRPNAGGPQPFVIFPADRSWRADFVFGPGEQTVKLPALSKFEGMTTLLVNIDQQEFALSFAVIPKAIETNPAVLAGYMLEKGCSQQAEALLRSVSTADASPKQ